MAAFPTDPLAVRFRYALNADLTALPSSWTWTDFTTDVDFTYDIDGKIGQPDDASEPNSELSFSIRNNDGKYTIDHPESTLWPYWREGVPIEYAWDLGDGAGWRVQQIAYLGASEIEWTANTPWRCVNRITAAGHFRRLGVDPDLASAMRRTIPSSRRRKAFWPLEDAAGSGQAASYYPAVPALVPSSSAGAPEFGTASLVPGAYSVANFKLGNQLFANLPTPTTSQSLRLSCLLYASAIPAGTAELFELRAAAGTIGRYVVEIGTGTLRFRAYTNAGVEVSGAAAIGFTAHQDAMVHFELDLAQTSAGNLSWSMKETTWRFDVDGLPVGTSGSASGTYSGTLGGITGVGVAPTAGVDDVQVGMLALAEAPLPLSGGFAAVLGWAGNTACGRIQGMCNEFGVPSEVTTTTLGVVMGPQIQGSLLANLRNVQDTDHGVLTDHRGVVAYTALSELYNQPAALTLSSLTRGQLGVMAPKRDDQRKANIASASRPAGTTATVADEDDIRMSGRFERSPITVNVAVDRALPGHAGWALAIGTQRGYDFRQLTLKPHLAASVSASMVNLTLGDRIAISSLPPQMPKGGLERIVRGRTTKLPGASPRRVIEITLDLVPTDVYDAYVLDSDRLDTAGTEVIVAATSADTGITVQTAQPKATVTGATSIPLWAAGEQVTLTAVADEALAEGFTGAPVANGWGSMPASTHVAAQPWTATVSVAPGTSADFARTGTSGTMTLQAAGSTLRTHLAGLPLLNPEMTTSFQINVNPTGAGIFAALQYRRGSGGGTDAYEANVQINPTGNPVLTLYAPSSVVLAQLVLAITPGPGTVYNMRVAPVGSRHRVIVWLSGSTEPAYWMIDVEDTTRMVAGAIGCRSGRLVGNTNAGTTVTTFYNVSFFGVQYFTVTRGVSGFSKALPVGSQVKLWRGRGMGI
jgi:hypothetical protein